MPKIAFVHPVIWEWINQLGWKEGEAVKTLKTHPSNNVGKQSLLSRQHYLES